MTNATVRRPGRADPGAARLPDPAGSAGDPWSIRTASLVAGLGLLGMAALAGFGYMVAIDGLVTPGDAARTAADISASEGLFRFGIVSLLLVVALDVVVAWALYRVFSPVSRSLSLLGAWLRLVYAGVFMAAVGQLHGVARLLGPGEHHSAFSPDQLHTQALLGVEAFTDIWSAGLVLFGLHLVVIGYLAHRSGYVPRLLGGLLAIAGAGYVVDSVAAVLSGGSWLELSTITFLGELVMAFWLVMRGRRLTLDADHGDLIGAER